MLAGSKPGGMRRCLAFIYLAAISPTAASDAMTFTRSSSLMDYGSCETYCSDLGSGVACIKNASDYDAVTEILDGDDGGWIAINDKSTEGTWEWPASCDSTYGSGLHTSLEGTGEWHPGEPNDFYNEDPPEDCAAQIYDCDFSPCAMTWVDYTCEEAHWYCVCGGYSASPTTPTVVDGAAPVCVNAAVATVAAVAAAKCALAYL